LEHVDEITFKQRIAKYRMGREKVSRVRRLDWWVKANNMRS